MAQPELFHRLVSEEKFLINVMLLKFLNCLFLHQRIHKGRFLCDSVKYNSSKIKYDLLTNERTCLSKAKTTLNDDKKNRA